MKKLAALAIVTLTLPSVSRGAAGIYDAYNIVYSTFNTGAGSNTQFYDIGASTINPDFQGASLGTFNRDNGGIFQLGGQEKSYKNNSTDVTGHALFYRIYTGAPSGSFTAVGYGFQWNQGDFGAPGNLNSSGDQQWGTDVQGLNTTDDRTGNLLTGLANGNYTIEVYSRINTNGTNELAQVFNNNGGSNFTASFTVVPEPSRALLLMAGALGCCLRRRR